MPRIRTIKPEHWTDERVLELSDAAHLIYIGSWNWADDEGFLQPSARQLLLRILPHRAYDADSLVGEIFDVGLFEHWRYADGKPMWRVSGFVLNQVINRPSTQARDRAVGARRALTEASVSPTNGTLLSAQQPDPPLPQMQARAGDSVSLHGALTAEGKGREKNKGATHPVDPHRIDPVQVVFDAWRDSTGKIDARLSGRTGTKRRRRIVAALDDYPLEDVVDAVRGWRHFPHNRGENDRHTIYNELDLLLRDAGQIERFRDAERAHRAVGHDRTADVERLRQRAAAHEAARVGAA